MVLDTLVMAALGRPREDMEQLAGDEKAVGQLFKKLNEHALVS